MSQEQQNTNNIDISEVLNSSFQFSQDQPKILILFYF